MTSIIYNISTIFLHILLYKYIRFARLEAVDEPVVYCTSDQLIQCVGEIEGAWDKCTSAGSVDDVLNCIQVDIYLSFYLFIYLHVSNYIVITIYILQGGPKTSL